MLEAIVLGVVQGVAEFLPISSTAHLILVPWLFGWGGELDTLSFDIALHVGTLMAMIVYFFKDWLDIFLKKHRLLLFLVIATIPGAIAGKLLDHFVETSMRSPIIIAASLVVVGVAMLLVERTSRGSACVDDINVFDSILMGLSQALALIPGVSRSGATITTGLLLGMRREEAARFSFLMATPIVAGAAALHGIHVLKHGIGDFKLVIFAAGVIASFISGIVTIRFLMYFFKKYSLACFAYYRIVLAVVIVVLLWMRS
ncbi:MAG: undecaprenyl-diphosphate phosphatase [Nitrospirae bacterium]|nr:undecaprenyl-diphosphate phosphatase [Nitrospirota bacterium]